MDTGVLELLDGCNDVFMTTMPTFIAMLQKFDQEGYKPAPANISTLIKSIPRLTELTVSDEDGAAFVEKVISTGVAPPMDRHHPVMGRKERMTIHLNDDVRIHLFRD